MRRNIRYEEITYIGNGNTRLLHRLTCLCLRHNRLKNQRYIAVCHCKLHICPGTECLDSGKLFLKNLLATAGKQGIRIGNEIVAVVDYCIVIRRNIILVFLIETERRQTLQVGRCRIGGTHQVGTYLAEKRSTVGYDLHLVNNSQYTVNGIGRSVNIVVFVKLYKLRVYVHHVGTRY